MISQNILDSLSSRFLICLESYERSAPERLFFILEEAHWFLIDNYKISGVSLAEFSKQVLDHAGIKINVEEALKCFVKYRQSVKVYGAILVDPNITRILAVKERKKAKNYSFPKGKKCMNEEGMECAVREIHEEIGYDAQNKICALPVMVFDKITLYFVFNVCPIFPFRAQTKKEIEEIRWLSIKKLNRDEYGRGYTIISTALKRVAGLLGALRKSRFKLNINKINERIDDLFRERHKQSLLEQIDLILSSHKHLLEKKFHEDEQDNN